MHQNKLTICIATFNRAKFLDYLLSSIIDEVNNINGVSIFVADGCSTDKTNQVCKKYKESSDSFDFIVLNEKGGIDKDFDMAVRHSNSEYCWLFCDDDYIEKGAIQEIFDKVNVHNPDMMIINSSVCDYELKNVLLEKSIDIDEDIVLSNEKNVHDKLFEICKTYLGVTDALLFRKELWCDVETEVFYGNRFGDMCTIGKFPKNSKAVIVNHPYVKIRLGNAEWTEISFKIWYEYYPETINIHSQLSDRVKKILVPNSFKWKFKFLLSYKAMGSYKLEQYRNYIIKDGFLLAMVGLLILLIPSIILRYLFIVIALIRKDKLATYNFSEGRLTKNTWKSDNNSI